MRWWLFNPRFWLWSLRQYFTRWTGIQPKRTIENRADGTVVVHSSDGTVTEVLPDGKTVKVKVPGMGRINIDTGKK